MRCLQLLFPLTFTVATAVAFTQYKRVEFYSARQMMSPTLPLRIRSFETAAMMSTYEYYETTNVTLEDQREILTKRMPAPIDDENMSKYQVEFRELLRGILYTKKETQAVLNPRMRAILEGIAASYYDHDVYRAFEILYEDYIPLRVAGRVVYRELRKVMDESIEYQQTQINTIMTVTGMLRSDIEDCWYTYMQVANGRTLSLDDLGNYMEPQSLKHVLHCSSASVGAEAEEIGAISFEQLLICLHDYNSRYSGTVNDSSSTVFFTEHPSGVNILQQALTWNDSIDKDIQKSQEQRLSPRRQKFNERYDDMIVNFSKWKPLIPSGDGRRLQILKGCFVGSENPSVVEALRVIYVDYAALRLSGDWIFKVVSALMSPIVRRHNRQKTKSLQL
jgi:hypothetical protein